MATTIEGVLEIDLVEFWEWVWKYQDYKGGEIVYGKPIFNEENQTLEIEFAGASEGCPLKWAKPPVFKNDWD